MTPLIANQHDINHITFQTKGVS